MTTCRSFKGEAGFTLAETMVAAGILAFALSACVLSFTMSMQAVKTGSNQMVALHSTRLELETLRTNSFSATALSQGTYAFTNGTITGTYTVTNLNSCTKNLTVNVNYMNYINRRTNAATVTLTTVLTSSLHP